MKRQRTILYVLLTLAFSLSLWICASAVYAEAGSVQVYLSVSKDGDFVTGEELQLADGNYYFNYYGAMVKNEVVNQKYYGADGKQVTKTGWYKVGTKWIYIQNGSMLYSGAKTINGTEYAFDYDGFLVTNSWYNGVYYNAAHTFLIHSFGEDMAFPVSHVLYFFCFKISEIENHK